MVVGDIALCFDEPGGEEKIPAIERSRKSIRLRGKKNRCVEGTNELWQVTNLDKLEIKVLSTNLCYSFDWDVDRGTIAFFIRYSEYATLSV